MVFTRTVTCASRRTCPGKMPVLAPIGVLYAYVDALIMPVLAPIGVLYAYMCTYEPQAQDAVCPASAGKPLRNHWRLLSGLQYMPDVVRVRRADQTIAQEAGSAVVAARRRGAPVG